MQHVNSTAIMAVWNHSNVCIQAQAKVQQQCSCNVVAKAWHVDSNDGALGISGMLTSYTLLLYHLCPVQERS